MEKDFAVQNRPHHCSISPGSSSPIGPNPNDFAEDNQFMESFGVRNRQLDDFNLNLSGIKTPKCIGGIIEVTSLTESNSEETILAAGERCNLDQWLVVYVRDTTTALIFTPLGFNSLPRCDLTSCMECLEKCGITQLIIASSSASSCSGDEFDLDLGPILKSSKIPDRIRVFEVVDLDSPVSKEAISSAKEGRERAHWVVLYVRGSTTAVLIPPLESHHNHVFTRSGLTAYLEWLEGVHMSQILVAVPSRDGESLCKKLLFMGFYILPREAVNEQLPPWWSMYTLLVTDLTGLCSSESSTPASSREDLNSYANSEVSLYSSEKPKSVVVVKVKDPGSLASMEAVLVAEGKRVASQWLVVYVEGSTTSILLPPRTASTEKGFSRSGFTSCLEWLECVGMSQVIIAVPSGDGESLCKSLLFLGFSMLPKDVTAEQLPSWLGGYILLITDL
ncbi:unnamed protein product [Rodentolepis nana]|uniref:ACT domain-containing protein n=1 Tax=Rodentolepis nana TaxID=102285 RepID=A0A0R3TMT7_RODNA|nr:unnamed protein product [Rodentolepis nana]